jgi:ComEC/Rec2-related protein
MKRPFAWPTLLFIAGILLANVADARFVFWLGVAFTSALAALWFKRERAPFLIFAIIAAGAASLTLRTQIVGPTDLRSIIGAEPRIALVRGSIAESPYQRSNDDRTRTLTKVKATYVRFNETSPWRAVDGTLAVISRGEPPEHLWPGQEVEVTGVVSQPEPALAPGLFDYRAFLKLLGIHYQLRADGPQDWKVLGSRSPPAGTRFNAWAKRTLAHGLPNDQALQLLWAMTLGWKTALNGEVSEPFMRSGTLHVFAISGLHVAMIAAIFAGLLRACQVPRRICGVIVIAVTWFYTYATDWQPSAVRSAIMASVFLGSWVLVRPPDVYNSLAAAALIILLCDPQQLFQAGFQLSFAVVFGLILCGEFARPWQRRIAQGDSLVPWEVRPWWQRTTIKVATYVSAMAITAAAAFLASIPLIAHYFHLFTPVSLIANLIVVPMSGAALASNLASLLCGAWCPWLTEIFNHGAWFWMKGMLWMSEWTARWPGAARHVSDPGLFATALYYLLFVAICAGWFARLRLRRWLVGIVALLGILTAIHWGGRARSTTMIVLPLGGGQAVLLDAPGNHRDILIDCGHERAGSAIVRPFLQSRGVDELPRLVLTHGDADHVGGFETIANYFSPRQIVTPAVSFRSPFYRKALESARARAIPILQLATNQRAGDWTALYPDAKDNPPQADDKALVLAATLNGTRVLLLGDLGPLGQKMVVERSLDVRADIVVTSVPKQGEPLTDSLLEKIHPRAIVVVDATYPADARARPALRQRLARRGVPVFYASEAGGITIDFGSVPAKVIPTRTSKITASEPDAPPQSSSEE